MQKSDDNELITNKGLYAIINLCYKLEYLNISDCKEISEITIWNVIYSCLRIQQLNIYEYKITYKTIEEIGLYLKLKYLNLGIATRYLEKISQGQTVSRKDYLSQHNIQNLIGSICTRVEREIIQCSVANNQNSDISQIYWQPNRRIISIEY